MRVDDFDGYFEAIKAQNWEELIPVHGAVDVTVKTQKSRLKSVPVCQAMGKKAVIEALRRKYRKSIFNETGPRYHIELSIHKDILEINLNTSGHGLHKRGYSLSRGEAPLRETLSAAMVMLSRWKPDRPFADPLCGSGTIPIEAALIGRNIAPGLYRGFDAEEWVFVDKNTWQRERERARRMQHDIALDIRASDINKKAFQMARDNASRAGIEHDIVFQRKNITEFITKTPHGVIVTNPPYGRRMGADSDIENLYKEMFRVFHDLDHWQYHILSAHEEFERLFGKKADKNRKLYNGSIKCYLYQYLT